MDDIVQSIIEDCFWEYDFTNDEIVTLAKSDDPKEQSFLFSKILANAKHLFASMRIFDEQDLKYLIENYHLSSFYATFLTRRINMLEYYFLDKPLTINELKWIA